MNFRTRVFSIILIICTVLGAVVYARSGQSVFEEHALFLGGKNTVRVWYTDDALTPYLQSKAVTYSEKMSKVRIEPKLVSGIEYLEAINKASLKGDNYPDLFIITNDSLEKAYLAGLALEVDNSNSFIDTKFIVFDLLDNLFSFLNCTQNCIHGYVFCEFIELTNPVKH